MPKYRLTIQDKNGKTETIISWYPIKAGGKIGWGPDDEAPDGIMRWTVIRCDLV